MKYLLFGSFFLSLLLSCTPTKNITTGERTEYTQFWRSSLRDSIQKNDYRMMFETSKTNITGICMVKQINDEWRGALINEFGIKVFDFVSTPQKCELIHVISFLDKRVIKKVIASDIQFLMEIDNPEYVRGAQSTRMFVQDTLFINYKNKKELQRLPDQTIIYKNKKRTLNYTFNKIDPDDCDCY